MTRGWNTSTPDRPVTDDAVVDAVERLGREVGSSFGPGFGRGWVQPGAVGLELSAGYGRVNGACLRLVASGRLVQGPQRSAFYKLSQREVAARRRREAAARRERVEDGDGEPVAERKRARPHKDHSRHSRLLG